MPITFIWGEEDFLIESNINKIKNDILGENISELNYKILDNPCYADFLYILKSLPLMFGEVVYNIKADRYFLETAKKIKLDDKQTDELIEAVRAISDKVYIVLTCQIARGEKKKPDSRKKLYRAMQKYGKIIECPAFKAYEEYKILPVLKNMLKKHNLKAENSSLEELIRRTGPYLRDLDSALDKIGLYIYPNNLITNNSIDNLYPVNRNIFILTDLILEKNYEKLFHEISNMLLYSHYLEIIAFLQSGFSKILNTKIYSKTLSPFEIAKKTGQNEYAVKMTLNKIKNIELREILKLKVNLTNSEYEIKTGEKDPITALLGGFLK